MSVSYVALLRGISPSHPNTQNTQLRTAFAKLEFRHIRTVISSGNVLFESDTTDQALLEVMIERGLEEHLGLSTAAFVRSRAELEQIIARSPFPGPNPPAQTNYNITFLKAAPHLDFSLPYQPPNKAYALIGHYDSQIYSTIQLDGAKTPDLMVWLEKQFTKAITTRTFKTVHRILAQMKA